MGVETQEVVIFDSSSLHTDRYPRSSRAAALGRYRLGRADGVWKTDVNPRYIESRVSILICCRFPGETLIPLLSATIVIGLNIEIDNTFYLYILYTL